MKRGGVMTSQERPSGLTALSLLGRNIPVNLWLTGELQLLWVTASLKRPAFLQEDEYVLLAPGTLCLLSPAPTPTLVFVTTSSMGEAAVSGRDGT